MARLGDTRIPGVQIVKALGSRSWGLLFMADRAWRYPYLVEQPERVELVVLDQTGAGADCGARRLSPDEVRRGYRVVGWNSVPAPQRGALLAELASRPRSGREGLAARSRQP
jgi:hypothetical protein